MDERIAPADRRFLDRALFGEPAAFDLEPAAREPALRVSPAVSSIVILVSSLGLWALIWFALTCLVSNWP